MMALLCLPVCAAHTQQTTPATGAPAAMAPLSHFDNAANAQSDLILGRNTKGPYLLSWKGIHPDTELVWRDGILLHRGVDYTFDPASGTIAFSLPLHSDQIVRVTYCADTADSAPNKQTFSMPFEWELWRQGKSRFLFNTVVQQNEAANGADATSSSLLSTLQFIGSTRLLTTSELASGVYIDLRGGDWLGRSGLHLAEKTTLHKADFSLSYSRAGAQFAQSQVSSLTAGREILEADAGLTPLTGLHIAGTLRETNTLPDLTKDPNAQETSMREAIASLSVNLPKNQGKIDLGRTLSDTITPNSPGTNQTQDHVMLEHALAPGIRASVAFQSDATIPTTRSGAEQLTQGTYTQQTQVQLQAKPNALVTLTGSFLNALQSGGPQDTANLSVEATPFSNLKKLKVTASWQDQFQPGGVNRNREATLVLPPLPIANTQITGGVKQTSSPGTERTVGQVDATTHPSRILEISGGARIRDGYVNNATPNPNAVNTYNVNVSLAPLKTLKFTSGLALNPEATGGDVRKTFARTFGLETTLGILKFTGKYGLESEYLTTRQSNLLQLGLDLRLTKWDTLTTGFEGNSDFDLTGSTIYRLGFTHRMGAAFDLSFDGSMTLRNLNGAPVPDGPELKAEAKVGLHF